MSHEPLPRDGDLMSAIGLGNHYSWHNGSGGCYGTRVAASEKLEQALIDAGLTPIPQLVALLKLVATSEDPKALHPHDDTYYLTTTWQCAADIIRAHLDPSDSQAERVEWLVAHWTPDDTTDGWVYGPNGATRRRRRSARLGA